MIGAGGPTDVVVVLTTASSYEEADQISAVLVERRLAACVQVVGPIESRHRWEGRVAMATEWLCLIKTTVDAYPALEVAINDVHSYDLPQIMAVPVVAGSAAYLAWVSEGTRPE
ncbi:MAG: divalent-cation tolerance protein CutA [Acidimicrobiales bacterium]